MIPKVRRLDFERSLPHKGDKRQLATLTQTEAMGTTKDKYDCMQHLLYTYYKTDECNEADKLEKMMWFEVGDVC